jgi:cardiolipin synthase
MDDAQHNPKANTAAVLDTDEPLALADRLQSIFETTLGVPFTDGNQIDVLRNGDAIFPAMLEAIAACDRTLEFLTFVYWQGEIAERFAHALADAARRGVEVRVILDAFGTKLMDRELLALMEDSGCEVAHFRPLSRVKIWQNLNRTHRKVMVCDGRVAFTGGVGIAQEWTGDARDEHEWRDTHFRVRGPAVDGLRAAFIGNWIEHDRPIQPIIADASRPQAAHGDARVACIRSTASIDWSDLTTAVRAIIGVSRQRLHIATAYFNPDTVAVELLEQAARRGVDVRILTNGEHGDHPVSHQTGRLMYRRLVNAGVTIYEFQPTMLHVKVITVDGTLAMIGSGNFNRRSLKKDDEVNLLVLDPPTLQTLDAHFEQDLQRSVAIPEDYVFKQPLLKRARGWWGLLFKDEL